MTLVDRYLGAVKDNLPRAQRDDIIEELEDSLRSRMEDEAATRGRPLTEAEEAAILKEFGNPMAVAARYRGDERSVTFGRRLIGPELFPTYMKVLTVNVVITLVIGAVVLFARRHDRVDVPGDPGATAHPVRGRDRSFSWQSTGATCSTPMPGIHGRFRRSVRMSM